jgi:hypothetical protein
MIPTKPKSAKVESATIGSTTNRPNARKITKNESAMSEIVVPRIISVTVETPKVRE